MAIYNGNRQERQIFFGNTPVREIFNGSRKMIGFNTVTASVSDFSASGGAEIRQGNNLIVIAIPDMEHIGGTGRTVEFCDDITICPFEGGVSLTDKTGGENLSVNYTSESSGLTDKYYLTINYKGNQVYKQEKSVYTSTRIRVCYDLSAKRLRVFFDNTLLYETPVILWRLWQVDFILGFYYYPPTVVGTSVIPGTFVGGWVQIFTLNKAVGYPRP